MIRIRTQIRTKARRRSRRGRYKIILFGLAIPFGRVLVRFTLITVSGIAWQIAQLKNGNDHPMACGKIAVHDGGKTKLTFKSLPCGRTKSISTCHRASCSRIGRFAILRALSARGFSASISSVSSSVRVRRIVFAPISYVGRACTAKMVFRR